ncbi:MAG TPA: type 1 glutamine amidotransferase domain-containing protein [Chloroflexota bacterium]|nr:type 1 glutamine amidotransferase domain-containing protein [Chloroflexota bacterium]
MPDLNGLRVACLATNGFEDSELTEPVKALRDNGAQVDIISPESGTISGKKGTPVQVDRVLSEARPEDYGAVLLPGGGTNADHLRMNLDVQSFLKVANGEGKPFAAICHAPWELISAGLARGRTMTGYYTIQDDIRNAGATYVDREVVVDGNLVTSRQPSDIPAFNREMLQLFALVPAGNKGA